MYEQRQFSGSTGFTHRDLHSEAHDDLDYRKLAYDLPSSSQNGGPGSNRTEGKCRGRSKSRTIKSDVAVCAG